MTSLFRNFFWVSTLECKLICWGREKTMISVHALFLDCAWRISPITKCVKQQLKCISLWCLESLSLLFYFNKGFFPLQESSSFEIAKQEERVYLDLGSDGSWRLKEKVSPSQFSFNMMDKSTVCLSLGIGLKASGESHILVFIIRSEEKVS